MFVNCEERTKTAQRAEILATWYKTPCRTRKLTLNFCSFLQSESPVFGPRELYLGPLGSRVCQSEQKTLAPQKKGARGERGGTGREGEGKGERGQEGGRGKVEREGLKPKLQSEQCFSSICVPYSGNILLPDLGTGSDCEKWLGCSVLTSKSAWVDGP